MTPSRGSIGISASFHPISFVRFPSLSKAPREYNNSKALTKDSSVGVVTYSNFARFPIPKAFIWRNMLARLVLQISGEDSWYRLSKSFLVHNL